MARLAMVIPTYNEAAHISDLLRALAALPEPPIIVVVDDASPDGTATLAEAESMRLTGIRVIRRAQGKGGRGGACLEGFKAALDTQSEFIGEMDGDFYHEPADIARLLAAVQSAGADFVIGSRYLPGGAPRGWPLRRHIFSRLANRFARLVLGVKVSDYTNGFRIYRREVILALLREPYRTKGYILLSEMLYRAHRLGYRPAEAPVICVNRKPQSNFSLREIKDAFLGILAIRFRRA